MKKFFTEKVISLGTAVIIILLCIAGTYLVTVSVSSGSASMPELPTLPPINTEKPIADDEELFLYACIDAFNGCRTSRALQCLPKEGTVRMAALSGSGTVLCYLYDEMKECKPSSTSDLIALLGLAPNTAAEKVIIFDIPSACVFRPAFNTDCTSGEMPDTQCALSDEQQAFIDSMIIAAAEKKIAFTRRGFSYNWKGKDCYGLTQFAANPAEGTIIAEMSIDAFIASPDDKQGAY